MAVKQLWQFSNEVMEKNLRKIPESLLILGRGLGRGNSTQLPGRTLDTQRHATHGVLQEDVQRWH